MPDSPQHESLQGSSGGERLTDQPDGGGGSHGDTHTGSDGPRQSIERAHPLQPSNSRRRFGFACCMPFLHRKHGLPCDSPEPTSHLDVCPQLSLNDQNEPPEPRASTKEGTPPEKSPDRSKKDPSGEKKARADKSKEKVKPANKKSSKDKGGNKPPAPDESEQAQLDVREEEAAKAAAKKFLDDLVGRVSGALVTREGSQEDLAEPKKAQADSRPVSSLALGKLVDGNLCALGAEKGLMLDDKGIADSGGSTRRPADADCPETVEAL